MAPTPRSLVLDLLATLPRGSMPVRALIEAAALFGISDNALRVALARLLARGEVARDGHGRYRLGPRATAVAARVASWRRAGDRLRPWRGAWVAVHGPERGGARRAAGGSGERALRLLGFRRLTRGLALRPDNLRQGVAALRRELAELGLGGESLVFRIDELDDDARERALALWDTARIRQGYEAAQSRLERSARRLATLPPAAAMVESFEIGGDVIRQIASDPLLPDELVPRAEREALVAAMRAYDRLGRACWRAFLRRHDVVPPSAPFQLRVGERKADARPTAEVAP